MIVSGIVNCGDDLLLVTGTLEDGSTVTATGWVSATTNHYDESDYDADGNLLPKATARKMTGAEVGEYGLRLLLEQNPQLQPADPVESRSTTPIAFVAPAPIELTAAVDSIAETGARL